MADAQHKEMQDQIKRSTDEMRLFQEEMFERMERLEAVSDSKFDNIHTALDILIQQIFEDSY
jgi:5-methylthioribose kinase